MIRLNMVARKILEGAAAILFLPVQEYQRKAAFRIIGARAVYGTSSARCILMSS